MADRITTRLEGTDRLKRKLSRYRQEVIRSVSMATEATAGEVQNAARNYAPVKTANLKDSIQAEKMSRPPTHDGGA